MDQPIKKKIVKNSSVVCLDKTSCKLQIREKKNSLDTADFLLSFKQFFFDYRK
jgi:hypothetical protein